MEVSKRQFNLMSLLSTDDKIGIIFLRRMKKLLCEQFGQEQSDLAW